MGEAATQETVQEVAQDSGARVEEIKSQMETLLKEHGKLTLKPFGKGQLAKGFRNEMVIFPIAAVQNRLEEVEQTFNKNVQSLQKSMQEQLQYLYQYLVKTENESNQLALAVQALKELTNISTEQLAEKIKEVTAKNTLEAETKEDAKQGLQVVNRAAQDGDTLKLSFVGKIDGVEFSGGKAENTTLKLGSGQFIPGFETQLIGVTAGQTVNVTVTFPTDYNAKELAGKTTVFETTVHTVKETIKTA